MKLKFLETLMDKKIDLEPVYKAGFKPIKLNFEVTNNDIQSLAPKNSYIAWYDEDNYKFDNIYRIEYYEDNTDGINIVFCQPYNSFFSGWWVPTGGMVDLINKGFVIPLIKKDDKDFSGYSGEDTELDD